MMLQRLQGLEQRLAGHDGDPAKLAALSSRLDAMAAHDSTAALNSRLDEVEHQLSGLTAEQAGVKTFAGRTSRMVRVEAAEIALAAGQPLGSIPDAPPALTRFATAPPPTESELRLAFSEAAESALLVSKPDTEGKPFFARMIARLQDFRLITIREGDRVLIGNSTATALNRANTLLEAGDLSGTVREVATLSGAPAEKMSAWMADARALLAAREALATLAGSG
jgi:hypothetical protein